MNRDYVMSRSTNTAETPAPGLVLLRCWFEERLWLVNDLVGLQYGTGATLEAAVADWQKAVEEFIAFVAEHNCAPNLVNEAAGYSRALAPAAAAPEEEDA